VTEAADDLPAIRGARARYLASGDRKALDESVRIGRSAVARLAGSDALEGAAALELAASLGALYEAEADPRHIDEALGLLEHAQTVLPGGHGDVPATYANMAALLVRRFAALGDPSDLQAAVAAAQRAVKISKPGDSGLPVRYANLAGILRTVYYATGERAFIDESIAAGRKGEELVQPSADSRCMILATLAGSLLARAGRTWSADDIAEGITTARRAVASAPPFSPQRPSAVSILAACLRLRFDVTGDLASLAEASGLHREMADLVPPQSAERALHLLQAAATLMARFDRLEIPADLDAAEIVARQAMDSANALTRAEAFRVRAACLQARCGALAADGDQEGAADIARLAVEAAEQARTLTDPADSSYQDRLVQLCNAKAALFEVTPTAAHRAEAIAAYEDTLERFGESSPSGQLCALNLGRIYTIATESGPSSRADIGKAMELFRQVLATTVAGQRAWAPALLGLLKSMALLFNIDRVAVDTGEVLRLYRQLADAPAVPPIHLARGGRLAGMLLMLSGANADAAGILTEAVRLLPAVAWRGMDRGSRETQLADLSGLGCDAAASLIAVGDGRGAVEAVEQGRSVLWADMLQLRRGDEALWQSHPEQATRLRDLAAALNAEDTPGEDQGISRAVDRRMALAAEWEELVARVRRQGFPDFLRPVRLASLLPAAANGPVVIVNVSEYRCDALLITADRTQAVALPLLRAQDVLSYTTRYFGAHARFDRAAATKADAEAVESARVDRERILTDILEWLWNTVAEPVLSALGFNDAPADGQPWPRVWWCPTGLLTLLPLHAAGRYTNDRAAAKQSVLDRVVSSYAPTLKALADANRNDQGTSDADTGTLLFVGLPDTPGQAPLPGATLERDLLTAKFGERCQVLYGEDATTTAVRTALPLHRSAHFSCHGEQNLAVPSKGGLLLHDGDLTIASLSAASYHGEFAFLSACKTATGGTVLPDEAISLAAALHYTGYKHVIATLWSVYDDAATEVAEHVYHELAIDSQLVPERSAHAVHSAVQSLRAAKPRQPSRWIPFIHIGP
jgi:hypothetical protein